MAGVNSCHAVRSLTGVRRPACGLVEPVATPAAFTDGPSVAAQQPDALGPVGRRMEQGGRRPVRGQSMDTGPSRQLAGDGTVSRGERAMCSPCHRPRRLRSWETRTSVPG